MNIPRKWQSTKHSIKTCIIHLLAHVILLWVCRVSDHKPILVKDFYTKINSFSRRYEAVINHAVTLLRHRHRLILLRVLRTHLHLGSKLLLLICILGIRLVEDWLLWFLIMHLRICRCLLKLICVSLIHIEAWVHLRVCRRTSLLMQDAMYVILSPLLCCSNKWYSGLCIVFLIILLIHF